MQEPTQLLHFDLRPEQKCHSKVMHRKEVIHSNGSYERKSRGQKLADEMGQGKAHDTLIDRCTGREWPVNCMTVISAWWRLNMRFLRSSGRSSGNPDGVWGPEKLLIRCGKESHHPAEWVLGLRLSIRRTRKIPKLTAIRVGVKILQFMFVLQLPLTRKHWATLFKPYNKVRDTIFLSRSLPASAFIIVSLWYCRWQYNTIISVHSILWLIKYT